MHDLKVEVYIRKPSKSELNWFESNKKITAYASDDNYIVLNPHSNLNHDSMISVTVNEGFRILIRLLNIEIKFPVCETTAKKFTNTAYNNNLQALSESIVARGIARDPSAGKLNEYQNGYIDAMRIYTFSILKIATYEEEFSSIVSATNEYLRTCAASGN